MLRFIGAILALLGFGLEKFMGLFKKNPVKDAYKEADRAEKERLKIGEEKAELEMDKEIEDKKKMDDESFYKRKKWIVALFIIPSLYGCFPKAPPDPIVIERQCVMAELGEKKDLLPVLWSECADMRCVDDVSYNNLKTNQINVEAYANYVVKVYNDAKGVCSE